MNKLLGKNIKLAIRVLDLGSATNIARLAKIDPKTVQAYEKGEGNPTLAKLEKIAKVMRIEPWLLISGELTEDSFRVKYPKKLTAPHLEILNIYEKANKDTKSMILGTVSWTYELSQRDHSELKNNPAKTIAKELAKNKP